MIFVRWALSCLVQESCSFAELSLTLGQAIDIAFSLPKGRNKGRLQGSSRAVNQAQEESARSMGLNRPSPRSLLKIHTHFLIPVSGMGTQQDKGLFVMEVNPGLPQVGAAALWAL